MRHWNARNGLPDVVPGRLIDSLPFMKPCPFCGEAPRLVPGDLEAATYLVNCTACEVDGPLSETERGALDAWNTRPGEDDWQQERDAALGQVDALVTAARRVLAWYPQNLIGHDRADRGWRDLAALRDAANGTPGPLPADNPVDSVVFDETLIDAASRVLDAWDRERAVLRIHQAEALDLLNRSYRRACGEVDRLPVEYRPFRPQLPVGGGDT